MTSGESGHSGKMSANDKQSAAPQNPSAIFNIDDTAIPVHVRPAPNPSNAEERGILGELLGDPDRAKCFLDAGEACGLVIDMDEADPDGSMGISVPRENAVQRGDGNTQIIIVKAKGEKTGNYWILT